MPIGKAPRAKFLLCFIAALAITFAIIYSLVLLAAHRLTKTPDNLYHYGGRTDPFRLNLPALYPNVTSPPESDCYKAWHALESVPCHDWIVDSDNDNKEMGQSQIQVVDLQRWCFLCIR